ncbi:MAG: flagellar biosynthesis anti-sigma factor FlgM [Gammaproteobacteria bacterium]|nr:flagellar biosynthesis anti-sigma factor FlgM [Pseudomonadales bacterium]MCP5345949.1 flagellar biosynthesis anti-sigma factor FlgM [Pseudomonadales bacterium]
MNKQSPEVQRVGQEDLEKLQDDELRKDLELLARMREQIEQLPEIDAARIVQLHDRIMRGEYQINGKRLAQKLDSFEADFQDPSSN